MPKSPEEIIRKLMREHDYPNTRLAIAIAQAEEYGCTIEYADDHTLQLDLDSPEALTTFATMLDLFITLGVVDIDHDLLEPEYTERLSKSGNRHITIKLIDPLPVEQRILLQACLGSDLKRELLSYARVRKGIDHPVLLFRPKEGANATDHTAGPLPF